MKGLKLQEEALAIRLKLFPGVPNFYVSESLNNIGVSYKKIAGQENFLKGLNYKDKALEMKLILY